MTELAVSMAIEQLQGLVDENPAMEEQLQGLKTDLRLMLSFLKESAGSRNRHHLICQVREMAYDVKVILDAFLFTRSEEPELEPIRLNNFLREIESIQSRFREVNKLKLQCPVEEVADVRWKNELAPWVGELDNIVGLGRRVEEMVEDLVSDQVIEYIRMIYGMGGIGKTTLARLVYNHASIVDRFKHRGWACFSSESRPEEVLRVLIRQVGDVVEEEVMEEMDLESLQQMLRQQLEGKMYFIVLDDAWDASCVEHVLAALPREGYPSKVVLTSRSVNTSDEYFHIVIQGHLNSGLSWQLFLKTVFNDDRKCPSHLEEIGRRIVKRCNGLPLAIKEAGKELLGKTLSASAWEETLKSMRFRVTMGVLESSYHRSSPEMKSCFVHMSFFKEGTTIRIDKLVNIWNAAGTVGRGEDHEKVDETVRKHLDELFDDSMIIMWDKTKDEYREKSLRLDVFLHRISINKAKEEIGFEILGNEEHCQSPCRPRHRAIYCSREKVNHSVTDHKHLISLFFHEGGNFDSTPAYWESLEQLKILDFEDFGLKNLPKMVCTLDKLRYLGLRDNYLQELPHALRRLRNLEVLDIALNFMVEVPDIIQEMDSLIHLYMSGIICRIPLKIDSLKNLHTLTYISVDNWTYELSNLEKMTSLRKLGIEELDENSDVSNLCTSLAKLKNLQCLILRGSRFRSMPPFYGLSGLHGLTQLKLDGKLTALSKCPPGIRYLTLVNSCLDEDPMRELEKLPNLCYLKLKNAYTGQEMVIMENGFPQIQAMSIGELWHLRNLRLGEGAELFVRRLKIYSCPYLDVLPKEITYLQCFSQLKMVTTRKIARSLSDGRALPPEHL